MPETRKLQSLLGFAQKAGRLVSGDFAVNSAFKEGRVKYLFLAKDISQNSQNKYLLLAQGAGVGINQDLTSLELGEAIGKGVRMSAALLDEGFLKMI